MRSMHISRGFPSTSPPHEPHRPALQFQRQAKSGACSACTLWMASRTTMPGWRGTVYSTMAPDSRVPRWMLSVTSSAMDGLLRTRSTRSDGGGPLDASRPSVRLVHQRLQVVGHLGERFLGHAQAFAVLADDQVASAPVLVRFRV